ncbi:MAG: RES family NAD+ phosphorylase [Myxococcota bacterium]
MEAEPWRVYQSRHVLSTRKLVDTAEEQDVLEGMLEESKPPVPEEARGLHELLHSPFRYPPLWHGSRFGSRSERGIWYGSESVETALAEVAFYRLRFLEDSAADLPGVALELGAYRARVRTEEGVDLAAPRFDAWREVLASPTSYAETQALGRAMRGDGGEAFRFVSARDPDGGVNVGVFEPRALEGTVRPSRRAWYGYVTREVVEYRPKPLVAAGPELIRFRRGVFEVEGELPVPAA